MRLAYIGWVEIFVILIGYFKCRKEKWESRFKLTILKPSEMACAILYRVEYCISRRRRRRTQPTIDIWNVLCFTLSIYSFSSLLSFAADRLGQRSHGRISVAVEFQSALMLDRSKNEQICNHSRKTIYTPNNFNRVSSMMTLYLPAIFAYQGI